MPVAAGWAAAVRVIDTADLGSRGAVKLRANTLKQTVLWHLERSGG